MSSERSPTLGFWSLFIVIFSAVGSGPSGIEGVIASANGISVAVLGVILYPLVWGLVQALCAAELSVRFKEVTGALGAWSLELFGKPLSLNATLYVIIMQLSTAAFVSEVSVAYIQAYDAAYFQGYWATVLMTFIIIAVSTLINLTNVRFVAKTFWVFSIHALVAFSVFLALCIPKMSASRFENPARSSKQIKWAPFINILTYNSAGFDGASSIVKYVKNPKVNLPRAMSAVALALTVVYVATLVLPYLATRDDASQWQVGHFVVAADYVGGRWLARWILVACIMTNVQIFSSALQTCIYLVSAQVKAGVLPAWMASPTENTGTPRRSLLVCSSVAALFSFLPLQLSLSVQSLFFVYIILLEVACFLKMDGKLALFSPSGVWMRRLIVTPTLVLAAFVISVQQSMLFFATLAATIVIAAYTVQPDTKPDPPLVYTRIIADKIRL